MPLTIMSDALDQSAGGTPRNATFGGCGKALNNDGGTALRWLRCASAGRWRECARAVFQNERREREFVDMLVGVLRLFMALGQLVTAVVRKLGGVGAIFFFGSAALYIAWLCMLEPVTRVDVFFARHLLDSAPHAVFHEHDVQSAVMLSKFWLALFMSATVGMEIAFGWRHSRKI